MGSFAGIGDTIFGVLFPTVFGSIASYLALKGNATGVLIWLLVNIAILIFRFYTVEIGYKQGAKLVGSMSTNLNALTSSATLLGVTVIGAMIGRSSVAVGAISLMTFLLRTNTLYLLASLPSIF